MAAVKKIPATKLVEATPVIVPQSFGMKTTHLSNSSSMVFREDGNNICPWCSGSHWLIGRVTAECAKCSYAIPLKNTSITGRARDAVTITSQDRHTPSPSQGSFVNIGAESR